MKKLFPIVLLLVVGGAAMYLYSTGILGDAAGSVPTGDPGAIAHQGVGATKHYGNVIYEQPWFWAMAVAVVGATFLRWLWKQMSGPLRGTFIAVIAIAAVVFVTSVKH